MQSEVLGLSPSQIGELVKDTATCRIEHYTPLLITGIPGIGKTDLQRQVCDAIGKPMWPLRPIQHETVEYTGLPSVNDGKAEWAPFADLLPTDPDWDGVIFVDEVTQLDTASQKIIASVLDKEGVAGRRIPKNARFILAGNRQQDRAGASRLISIIESRCLQVEMLFSLEDWREWALSNGVHSIVHSFADFKGRSFVNFDSSKSLNPLPRTWEKVSHRLHANPDAPTDKNDPVMTAAISGLVGVGPANEFLAFREHYATLHGFVDAALSDPNGVTIDRNNVSACHCMIGAVTDKVREENGTITDDRLRNLITLSKRFSDPMAALICQKLGAKATLRIGTLPEGREWYAKYRPFFEKVR